MQNLIDIYQPYPASLEKPRILIVDDKSENRLALSKLLEKLDLIIIQAESGNDALKSVLKNEFALILLDVQMPEMDGIELLEILRNDILTQHIPIILFTADHLDNSRYIQAYKTGAVDFLYKPINPAILISKVKIFIDLYNSQINLRILSQQHEIILNSAGEGICGLDLDARISFANPSAERIAEQKLGGLDFDSLLCEANVESLCLGDKQQISQAIVSRVSYRSDQFSLKTANGYHVPISLSITPVKNEFIKNLIAVVVFSDITDSKKLENRLSKLARYDSLTGLANRTLFYENLSKAISRAKRHNNIFALFFIDLDQFKKINDTLGHGAGDALLVQAAQRIQKQCREEDSLARIGGDEFTILIEDVGTISDIQYIVQKIIAITHEPFNLQDQEHVITISVGVATFPQSGTDIETLTRNADIAMYRAKETGRNNYQFYSSGLTSKITNKVNMEQRLRKAINNNEFELFYQPKIQLNNKKVTGFEALIRWHDPDHGCIFPEDFIPIAEETGLILDIGDWVIAEALQQKEIWNKAGFPQDLKIAINLSSCQFAKKDLLSSFGKLLTNSTSTHSILEVEITETAVMQDLSKTNQLLDKIHDMGISIAIDDFGIGYSSFSQLRLLPVDTIKVDKSFVRDITKDSNDAAIIKAIINMADSLELNVVAEGIETQQQYELLKKYKCNEGQGYHFYKPVPANEITLELLS